MRLLLALAMALAAAAAPARAQVDRESLDVLGWSKACSVAVQYYGYPAMGSAMFNVPITMQIGTISLQEPAKTASVDWLLNIEGKSVWDPEKAAATIA
ncbi:MAG: hypothetical protein WC943_04390, partial [Elusimicrobiota bacterium]